MKNNIKKIKRDCFSAMVPAWLVSTLETVLTGVLSVWITTIVAGFTDAILELNKDALMERAWKIVLGVFISVFIFPLISYLCNMLTIKRALNHDRKVMGRFLRKKYNEAMKMGVGEAQARLEDDPNSYRLEWMEMMTQVVSLPIICFYLLYNSLSLNWQYTLITIAISAGRLFVPIAVKKLNAKYDKETRDYATELRKYEMDITSMPHYTVMLGIEDGMLNRIDEKFRNYYNRTGRKSTVIASVTSFFSSAIDSISGTMIIIVGAVLVSQNSASPGTLAAMLGFSSIYNNIINSVIYIIKERLIIKTLVDRMNVLYDNAEKFNGQTIEKIDSFSAAGLSCKYGNTPVFEPLNFSIQAGEKVAVCGENGSGKSTLLRILCGLNSDYTGSITVNGIEMSSVFLDSLRSQVSLATQEPFLFPGTVLENLTFGGLASKEDAMRVLNDMGIAFLSDRDISVKQDNLSVGEKQRISLSRAILKKATVIFLDEPSNNLDENSILKLKKFISSSSKTVVYISHTDSLIELASKVIMVKKVKNQ